MARPKSPAASNAIDRFVGSQIRVVREQKGVKQNELASAIGVDPNSMGRYEAGNVALKSYWLFKIAHVLRVPVQTFFAGIQDDSETQDWIDEIPPLDMHAARIMTKLPRLGLDQRKALAAFIDTLVDEASAAEEEA